MKATPVRGNNLRLSPELASNRMAWVNGRGYQRECSYLYHAAVAEMSIGHYLGIPLSE